MIKIGYRHFGKGAGFMFFKCQDEFDAWYKDNVKDDYTYKITGILEYE